MLTTFINMLMSAEAEALCGAAYGQSSPERVNVCNGYRAREFDTRAGTLRGRNPQVAHGLILPRLAAAAAPPGGGGADHGGGHVLPARGVNPADGELGGVPREHKAEQVTGLGDGGRARRPRRGLPLAAPGRRPVHVRRRGRAGAQGARGWPRGERRLVATASGVRQGGVRRSPPAANAPTRVVQPCRSSAVPCPRQVEPAQQREHHYDWGVPRFAAAVSIPCTARSRAAASGVTERVA
jgi:hypothetical protein